jgi:hypothetical protein
MNPDGIAAYLDQASAVLDLPVAPTYRDGVAAQFAINAAMAALVLGWALPDEAGSAAVFVP